MKKTYIFQMTFIVLTALIISGCGHRVAVTLDADSYGKASLTNGAVVLFNVDKTTSLTAATILFNGGVLTEDKNNNGITNLMIKMLLKGNADMSASEITDELDFLGVSVTAGCSQDYSYITIMALSENFEKALSIVARSILAPAFPEEELEKLKIEIEGNIKSNNDNPGAVSSNLFWATIYGDKGYGLPTTGTIESIKNITTLDIKNHYQKYIGGGNLIIAVASDMPADSLYLLIDEKLGGLKKEATVIDKPDLSLSAEKEGFISFERNQSFIYKGFVFDQLKASEVPLLRLVHDVVGNSVGSRLWALRFNEKLAYAVYSQFITNKYCGVFRAGIGTDTSKVGQALQSLDRELNKLLADGITAEELAIGKMKFKNNMIYWIDNKGGRAFNMASFESIGYGHRFVLDMIKMSGSATLDQVNNFVKEKFSSERNYLAIAGKK